MQPKYKTSTAQEESSETLGTFQQLPKHKKVKHAPVRTRTDFLTRLAAYENAAKKNFSLVK